MYMDTAWVPEMWWRYLIGGLWDSFSLKKIQGVLCCRNISVAWRYKRLEFMRNIQLAWSIGSQQHTASLSYFIPLTSFVLFIITIFVKKLHIKTDTIYCLPRPHEFCSRKQNKTKETVCCIEQKPNKREKNMVWYIREKQQKPTKNYNGLPLLQEVLSLFTWKKQASMNSHYKRKTSHLKKTPL